MKMMEADEEGSRNCENWIFDKHARTLSGNEEIKSDLIERRWGHNNNALSFVKSSNGMYHLRTDLIRLCQNFQTLSAAAQYKHCATHIVQRCWHGPIASRFVRFFRSHTVSWLRVNGKCYQSQQLQVNSCRKIESCEYLSQLTFFFGRGWMW